MKLEIGLLIAILILVSLNLLLSVGKRVKAFKAHTLWVNPGKAMRSFQLAVRICPDATWKWPFQVGMRIVKVGAWVAGLGGVDVQKEREPAEEGNAIAEKPWRLN